MTLTRLGTVPVGRVAVCLLVVSVVLVSASETQQYVFVAKWGSEGTGDGQFDKPCGVAVDTSGNVYVADTSNHRIQKFDSSGAFAMKWGSAGTGDGQFDRPMGLALDASGNAWVADTFNRRLQKFDPAGAYLTEFIAPSPDLLHDVALSPVAPFMYAAEAGHISKFTVTHGWGERFGSYGSGDGQFDFPYGVATDATGDVYVADKYNYRIQRFDLCGYFEAKWGSPGHGEGQFINPYGVAVDTSGDVYVADTGNHRIQKFTRDGTFLSKWGSEGTGDGQFSLPQGVVVDASANVYVADTGNNRIQKFAPLPTLEWVGATGYETDGVDPETGEYPLTVFTFRVVYTDVDGGLPSYCRLVLDRDGSTRSFDMKRGSGNTATGRQFLFRKRLAPGFCRYRIEAHDGDDAATGAPTEWTDGPVVCPRQNGRPDGLVWAGGRWLGDNWYNTTGAKQRVNATIASAGSVTYEVKLQNDRADPDTLLVMGPPSKGSWQIAYEDAGGADITSAVTGNGWEAPELASGGETTVSVHVTGQGDPGAWKSVLVQVGRAVWGPSKNASSADTAKMVTTVEGAAPSGMVHITGLTASPTSMGAQVQFALSAAAQVDARVLNIAGRPIKTICTARDCEAGANTLLWNAQADNGLAVPNGQYLVELTARTLDGALTRRLTQVRVDR